MKLMPLIEKEVKDLLRDPRIYIGLIIPVIMMPLLGLVMTTAIQSSTDVGFSDLQVSLLDYDETDASQGFTVYLTSIGINVSSVSSSNVADALEESRSLGSKAFIMVPDGFEDSLLGYGRARLEVYSFMESVGIASVGVYSMIDGALSMYSRMLSAALISKLDDQVNPEAIMNPLNITRYTIVKDTILEAHPEALFGQLFMGYSILIPTVLFILAITVAQVAATATAVENEEKTLETLLTFPLTRYDILFAKLIGSSIIAVLGGLLFTVGFFMYYQGFFAIPGFSGGAVGLGDLPPPPLLSFVLVAVTLILSILFMTSLGIVIGALSSDVRMAGSMLGIIIVPVLIPFMFVMYGDLNSLPFVFQILAYALPTSYPMILSKGMVTSTIPIEVIYGIPYSVFLTLVVIYLTSKMLVPEKLFSLQHKLKLRRMKGSKTKDLE